MVKKFFLSALALILSAAVLNSADISADVETGGTWLYGRGKILTTSSLDFNDALLSGKLSLSYTPSLDPVKGEVKGTLTYSSLLGKASDSLPASAGVKDITSVSLEKAYLKFRFPLFSAKRKATVTFGKAPVSWGKGYYYRTGDVLWENEYDELEKNGDASRSLWLITLDQNFGSGFAATLGVSIPLEGQKTILALNLRKTVSSDFLKGIYLSYAYRFGRGKENIISLSLDGTLFFDFILGAETAFREGKDFTFVLNMMRQFAVASDESEHGVMMYLCGKYSLYDGSCGAMMSLSYDVTERLDISLSSLMELMDRGSGSLTLSLGTEASINDNVTLFSSGSWMRDFEEGSDLYLFTISFKGSF